MEESFPIDHRGILKRGGRERVAMTMPEAQWLSHRYAERGIEHALTPPANELDGRRCRRQFELLVHRRTARAMAHVPVTWMELPFERADAIDAVEGLYTALPDLDWALHLAHGMTYEEALAKAMPTFAAHRADEPVELIWPCWRTVHLRDALDTAGIPYEHGRVPKRWQPEAMEAMLEHVPRHIQRTCCSHEGLDWFRVRIDAGFAAHLAGSLWCAPFDDLWTCAYLEELCYGDNQVDPDEEPSVGIAAGAEWERLLRDSKAASDDPGASPSPTSPRSKEGMA